MKKTQLNFDKYIDTNDALFHYTSIHTCIENILPTQKLRLSIFSKTDDPLEYNFWMFGLIGWSLPENIIEKWNPASNYLNLIIKKHSFISCFCTNSIFHKIDEYGNDDGEIKLFGYKRSRMWSQYADHQRGVCLVFSKSEINNYLSKTKLKMFAREVKYNLYDELEYNALSIDGNILSDSTPESTAIMHLSKHVNSIYFSKNIDYRDESEFRIVVIDEHENNIYKEIDIRKMLKGIILGDRFPEVYIPSVAKLIHNSKIRILKWNDGSYIPLLIKKNT